MDSKKILKTIYLLAFIVILIGVTTTANLFKKGTELATYKSPDGNYELIIKNDRSIFFTTMPGDGGNPAVEVILKDANGYIIGTSNSNSNCAIFKDSIIVSWDLKNEQVWYGKAKTIHLKTGKVEC